MLTFQINSIGPKYLGWRLREPDLSSKARFLWTNKLSLQFCTQLVSAFCKVLSDWLIRSFNGFLSFFDCFSFRKQKFVGRWIWWRQNVHTYCDKMSTVAKIECSVHCSSVIWWVLCYFKVYEILSPLDLSKLTNERDNSSALRLMVSLWPSIWGRKADDGESLVARLLKRFFFRSYSWTWDLCRIKCFLKGRNACTHGSWNIKLL